MRYALPLVLVWLLAGQTQPPVKPAPQSAAEEGLEVRYARARLQLAEANLARIEQMNRKLKRTVPESVVTDFRDELEVTREQFRQASQGDPQGEFAVWLRRAESSVRSARQRWRDAVAANQRVQDTIPAIDVERFRLRAEVARLQFDRGRKLAAASRDAQLAWQVELLNDELELLKEETTRIAPFVRYYPIWLY
jgi:hypothetical protein